MNRCLVEIDKISMGEIVRERRKELDIAQDAFADAIKRNVSYVSGIECGNENPSLKTFLNICKILKLNPDEILVDSLETIDKQKSKSNRIQLEILKCIENISVNKQEKLLKMVEIFVSACEGEE